MQRGKKLNSCEASGMVLFNRRIVFYGYFLAAMKKRTKAVESFLQNL